MPGVCRPRLRTKRAMLWWWRIQPGECRPRLMMRSSPVRVECMLEVYRPQRKTSCCWEKLEGLLQRSSSKQAGSPAELSTLGMRSDRCCP